MHIPENMFLFAELTPFPIVMKFKSLKKYLLIPAIVILVQSCDDNPYFVLKTFDVNYANRTEGVVSGKKVDLGIMGMDDIFVYDTLLLATSTNPNGMLSVFSTDSHKQLASICKRGRAKNEFLRPTCYSRQLYVRNGDLIIPLMDDVPVLKEVNVSQSIINQATVVVDEIGISNNDGRYLLIDNDLRNQFVNLDAGLRPGGSGEVFTPKYYISKDGKEEEIKVFPELMNFEDESDSEMFYYGEMYKHPSKNIAVQPMVFVDYILFFDLDNKRYYAVHQKGSREYDAEAVSSEQQELHYFQGVEVTDDFLFVLYFAGDYCVNNPNNPDAAPELLVFDWDGNYLTGVKLDTRVKSIAYDSKHQVLYGLNRIKDEIYSFDISDVMDRLNN